MNTRRIIFAVVCFAIGGVSSYYSQPYIHENSDALLVITTVFAVFAGFMVAIITILGDPAYIPEGNWRAPETRRDSIERKIAWHVALFILYLITISLVFVAVVVKKTPDSIVGEWIKVWIDRSYMFFGVSTFLLSFALPTMLHKTQMARIDAETERRRAAAGISDSSLNRENR
jgi:hypothetical protein